MTDRYWNLLVVALAVLVLATAVTHHVTLAFVFLVALVVVGVWRQRI